MAEKRYCSECGSGRRMESRPADSDLCTVCSGEERHPNDPRNGLKGWTFKKGYYNDQKGIEEMLKQPGQGVDRG
jgi:hypothetical protein